MITRTWMTKDTCKLVDTLTGRMLMLCIPGTGLLDKIELEELMLEQEEDFATQCLTPLPVKIPLTQNNAKALFKVCFEIREHKLRMRETGQKKYQ